MKRYSRAFIFLFFLLCNLTPAFAWHDETHLAVARAAGYIKWYNAAGPDITKTKAGNKEGMNHWYDNSARVEITARMVLDQAARYDTENDPEGHLYGAIIRSLRNYIQDMGKGKYSEYHMTFCAHYIADLSQPLHNGPYDENKKEGFNDREHHERNDGIVDMEALNNIGLIQKGSYQITVNNEEDLAREIARIANLSYQLYSKMHKENKRDMTKDEAYAQLSHSASLLRAVLAYAERSDDFNILSTCPGTKP